MSVLKFQKGDWCFCEFKLQQVQETTDNRITSVSDGSFSLSSNDLSDRCFPLELDVKRISDSVSYWSEEFHKIKVNINHPDLNRELISRWVEMCEHRKDADTLKMLYKRLDQFGQSIVNRVRDLTYEEIEGVRLFR